MTAASQDAPNRSAVSEVRLGSGTAYGLASQVVNLGTSFLVGVLIARLLGPEGKGTLSVVLQVTGILLVALNLGIAGSNLYFIARGRMSAGTALGNSMLMALVCGAVAAPFIVALMIL